MPDPLLISMIKWASLSATVTIIVWIAQYTAYTKGGAWKTHIGASLMSMKVLVGLVLGLTFLEQVFRFSPATHHVIDWGETIAIILLTPAMGYRIAAWYLDRPRRTEKR